MTTEREKALAQVHDGAARVKLAAMFADPTRVDWYLGLRFEQVTGHSALAVVSQSWDGSALYRVQHIKVWEPNTPFINIAEYVGHVYRDTRFNSGFRALAVDETAVGPKCREWLADVRLEDYMPYTVEGTESPQGRVALRDLVAHLQRLVACGRLRVSRQLPGGEGLLKEMANFQCPTDAEGRPTFKGHASRLLAVGLACWHGWWWELVFRDNK